METLQSNTDILLFEGDTKKIQNTIKHYIDYQYDRGLSPVTMKGHYNAIKHSRRMGSRKGNVISDTAKTTEDKEE